MKKDSKIYIAGSSGMVGSAILRTLQFEGYTNIITRTHEELDLTNQVEVKWFLKEQQPEYIFVCCGRVGGIKGNSTYPVEFLYENMMMGMNIMKYSHEAGVKKLLYLGSSCILPKECPQPIKSEYLLTGKLEPTNEGYALAKASNIRLAQFYNKQYNTNFITALPASIYGYGDNFHPENSHLIPGIMQRMHNVKINNIEEVEIWGSGIIEREFLYSSDLADACVFLMNHYNNTETINIGAGFDMNIKQIVKDIAEVVGFTGKIKYDTTKPDGTLKKLLDSSEIFKLGWKPKIKFEDGLKMLYKYYLEEVL